jgi:hypothetical protein
MSTPDNELPSEQAVPGIAGSFRPEDADPGIEEPEAVVPEEDDEHALREIERERRAEDVNP